MAGEADTTARVRAAVQAGFAVRPMEAPDAPAVADVHVRVWREAYASLLPAEHLADLDVADFAARWRERLLNPTTPGLRHLLGLDPSGQVVGIASAGPARDPEPPVMRELWGLNVLASAHGTGLADLLLSELIGTDDCYLWVLRGNVRAAAFYTRHGFLPDGSTKPYPATGSIEERMVRRPGGWPERVGGV